MSSTEQIVVGVDGSDSSIGAVDYVGRIVGGREGFVVHLAFVVGPLPPELSSGRAEAQAGAKNGAAKKREAEQASWLGEARAKADPILAQARTVLTANGVGKGSVRTELLECRSGDDVAARLVEFTIGRKAGTLAVGWSAYSRLAEIFHRHVGEEIVEAEDRLTSWIVRDGSTRVPDIGPQRILLGLDETEPSMRAVDYVGRILAGSTTARVHLFQALMPVKPAPTDYMATSPGAAKSTDAQLEEAEQRRLRRATTDAGALFERARAALADAGFDASLVDDSCSDRFLRKQDVPDAILAAARESQCDTLVVGRSALPWFRELFRRHVGAELAARAKQFTVWSVE